MLFSSAESTFSQLKGPVQLYQDRVQKEGLVLDQAQQSVVVGLDTLWQQLLVFKMRRNQFLGRSLLSPMVPKGLYLWGGVGRGKTLLMDLFFNSLPYKRKLRVHFHQFMSDFHHDMQVHQHHADPLFSVAQLWSERLRVLCLDEFYVENIADAMILARLLDILLSRGIVLVVTSNCAPDNLYANGLQRQSFLPAIELLKKYLKVINLGGQQDYRLQVKAEGGFYIGPLREQNELEMAHLFEHLAQSEILTAQKLNLAGHELKVWKQAGRMIWLDFDEVCGGAHSQEDYLLLVMAFDTVFMSHIPILTVDKSAEARRLMWLVDVLYDHHTKLVASMEVSPAELLQDKTNIGFERTISRMIEMQSLSTK